MSKVSEAVAMRERIEAMLAVVDSDLAEATSIGVKVSSLQEARVRHIDRAKKTLKEIEVLRKG